MLGYLASAALCALFAGVIGLSLGAACLGGVAGFAIGFLTLPVLAGDFWGLAGLAVLGTVLGWIVFAIRAERSALPPQLPLAMTLVALLWAFVAPAVSTLPILHAGAYRALLGPVDTVTNTPELAPMDPARLRVVDRPLAEKLAERVLGEKGALGSQVTVGTMDLQVVRGEWYFVAPLNHSGFFKWLDNTSGTPGYVMVSAVDPRDVRLVTELQGKPLQLRHNFGAYFGDDPERALYANGFAGTGLRDFSFEIDEDGRPFVVATTYEHRIGFGGAVATGAILLDAQTGAITRCRVADCPAWVDLIQPADLVHDRVTDWGEYVHGWWNPSKREQLTTTDSMTRILGKDGRQYHYTGITSAASDKGTTGFMLVETRTGRASYHLQSGATEDAAMASAQGSVQEKGYKAVAPTPYDVNGAWTYLVPLKDDAGFVKALAFVSVANDQVLAVGETAEAALRKYRQVLVSGGHAVAADGAALRRLTLRGHVKRLGVDVRGGDTYYVLWLDSVDSLAFVGSSAVSPLLPLTREGDLVTVEVADAGRGVVDLAAFDNPTLPLRRSAPDAQAARSETARGAAGADAARPAARGDTGRAIVAAAKAP